MDDEKLIEMVRKYEFLYNIKHPKYMDGARKDVAWKDIAEHLKQPTAACKLRWQSLRDAYRRSLNKKKKRTSKTGKSVRKWKYESEMAFVVPFFTERKRQDSMENASDDEDDESEEALELRSSCRIEPEKSNNDTANENATSNSNCDSREVLEEDCDSNKTGNNKTQENETIKAKGVKRKIVELEQSISPMLMAKLIEDQGKIEDELDRFFLNISDTVKKFAPYQQALAKNKIFMLVSEMELQQLASSDSSRFAFCSSSQPESFNHLQNATLRTTSPENSTNQSNFYDTKLH